jgi:CRISPR-associated protein (TIGR03984 family)
VTDAQHHPLSLSQYFEARIFNPTCELRWLNRDAGKGQMVVLSDKKLNLNQPHLTLSEYKVEKHLYQTYLLWGKAVPNAKTKDGWQRLTESRIGKLDVPIGTALNPNQRVYLRSQEYLAPVDDFGNVAVIGERLVKLLVKLEVK